ncbi:DUF6289 family protein [Lentzea terrae]|uniref:DUF6289 family protein n=1 Tax=Lentzea terrae TaxID=2200761 RepID=UPI000DD4724A|nr:DUF6289 family protein [Lentzea terrae]
MFKRVFTAALFTAAIATATAAPASAIPTIPAPTPDRLVVISYYTDHQHRDLVGQVWFGCGAPRDSWGVQTNQATLHTVLCGPAPRT